MAEVLILDQTLKTVMLIVQILGGIGMLVAIVTAIWSLWLQKKEVMKQNAKIIEQNTKIISLLKSIKYKLK